MVGYVWPPEDYPWLSLYRSVVDGKIAARGLEFGTGGLHQPFGVLIKEGPILGRPNVHWLDAGETRTLRYGCFLLPAEDGTAGVSHLALSSSELIVKPIRTAQASGTLHLNCPHCAETWSRLTGWLMQRANRRRHCTSRLIGRCLAEVCLLSTASVSGVTNHFV